jgi:hypothetical protein
MLPKIGVSSLRKSNTKLLLIVFLILLGLGLLGVLSFALAGTSSNGPDDDNKPKTLNQICDQVKEEMKPGEIREFTVDHNVTLQERFDLISRLSVETRRSVKIDLIGENILKIRIY